MSARLSYVWDYEIDENLFSEILAGRVVLGHLNQQWAVTRLLEYAPYKEIVRLLGFAGIRLHWPIVRSKIRSESRKRGFDFLVEWLPSKHPELLHG